MFPTIRVSSFTVVLFSVNNLHPHDHYENY